MVQRPSTVKSAPVSRSPVKKSKLEPVPAVEFKPESEPLVKPVPEGAPKKEAPPKKAAPKAAPNKPPVRKPAVSAKPAVAKPAPKKPPVKVSPEKKPAKKAPAKKPQPSKEERVKLRAVKRLAGIRAAAGEIARRLDDIDKARTALGDGLRKSAEGDITRVKNVVDNLARMVMSAPLIDPNRLEKDLAMLTEKASVLKEREAKGRKRDLLAVDDFLGEAALRLEKVVSSAAAANLKLLQVRLADLEAVRESLRSTVDNRFKTRVDTSRHVLLALEEATGKMGGAVLGKVSEELDEVVSILKAIPVEKLEGRRKDLFRLDFLIKKTNKRMGDVMDIIEDCRKAEKKENKSKSSKEVKSGSKTVSPKVAPPKPAADLDD